MLTSSYVYGNIIQSSIGGAINMCLQKTMTNDWLQASSTLLDFAFKKAQWNSLLSNICLEKSTMYILCC